MRSDLYLSVDIEADGPVPGVNSMLSFGLVIAATFDGNAFIPAEPDAPTFYRTLRPISEDFDPDALAVSGLDRDALVRKGEDPMVAMDAAADWIAEIAGDHRPVLVAWPLAYDWLFLQWYFLRFGTADSPFGFSSCLDMKTLFWRHAGVPVDGAGMDDLPAELRGSAAHTHHALDDARQQADIFVRLCRAAGLGA
jgi:DNA polymerase III epsilon subunit-like protein